MVAPPPPPSPATAASDLGALRRVMARLTAHSDHEGVLAALAHGLVEEFGVDSADVWLHDPADGTLHRRAAAQRAETHVALPACITLEDSDLPIASAVRQRAPLVLDDLQREEASPGIERADLAGLAAYAAFPLVAGDRLCGAMSVLRREPFPPVMVEALAVLAEEAALALDYARVIEESRPLQSLAAEIASARDPQALLDNLVERVMTALEVDACAVWLMAERRDGVASVVSRGLSTEFLTRTLRWHDTHGTPGVQTMLRTRRPTFAEDTQRVAGDTERAAIVAAEGIVSTLLLPLFSPGDTIIGTLILYHRRQRRYGTGEIRLAQAFADQIAVALHNARLSEQERSARESAARQLERLTTLTQITRQLLAATDLDVVLQVVVEAARRLCQTTGAMVGLIDEERRHINAVASVGEPRAFFERFKRPVLDEAYLAGTATGRALAESRAVAVEDYAAWSGGHALSAETVRLGVRSFVVAPLLVDGAAIGVLWVNHAAVRSFSAEDVALVQALADHAALAIEHARLLARGREAAVLEERARLARDLHDSVTQSVFSVGLMTNAALGQHERGLPVEETLRRIKAVSQDALAEMRALFYELHPAALAEEGLAKALQKLVVAMQVRVDVPITFGGETERRLAPDTETAIFRIVQEALGNAAKYAQATELTVTLLEADGQMRVVVQGNGVGFDPQAPVSASADGKGGGMGGLRSMQARALAAGLGLQIESAPGAGTRVIVKAPFAWH